MKVLPAYHIITKALESGRVNKSSKIIDTSSGTFALGLALVCNYYGLELIIVSDPAMDEELKRRIEDLGAMVIIVKDPDRKGDFQNKRLNVVRDIVEKEENIFWCKQYDNPDNVNAYSVLSNNLMQLLPNSFTLVGTVGSGGSTTGIGKFVREINPNVELVGVDTFGSILFGISNGKEN